VVIIKKCEIRVKNKLVVKKIYFILFIATIFACHHSPKTGPYVKLAGKAQGTFYHITYENTIEKDLSTDIDERLKKFDAIFSIYDSTTIISKINRNEFNSTLPTIFKEVLDQSHEVYKKSNGAFDITVGPVVRAWGFGPEKRKTPAKRVVDSLLRLVGMYKIGIKDGKFVKSDPRIQIDVNGIAQGFSVDLVSKFLDSLEIENYMVEIGGEVRAKGKNEKGKLWRIGIDKPVDNNEAPGEELQEIISLDNLSVSTSGNYRKFYIENGVKYSHTIDPYTGYPAKNTILSATVVTKECAYADAIATALMVMGLDKSKVFLNQNPELKVLLVYSDSIGNFNEFMTENFKTIISH
jgi:FAD:protein FMN transferase